MPSFTSTLILTPSKGSECPFFNSPIRMTGDFPPDGEVLVVGPVAGIKGASEVGTDDVVRSASMSGVGSRSSYALWPFATSLMAGSVCRSPYCSSLENTLEPKSHIEMTSTPYLSLPFKNEKTVDRRSPSSSVFGKAIVMTSGGKGCDCGGSRRYAQCFAEVLLRQHV